MKTMLYDIEYRSVGSSVLAPQARTFIVWDGYADDHKTQTAHVAHCQSSQESVSNSCLTCLRNAVYVAVLVFLLTICGVVLFAESSRFDAVNDKLTHTAHTTIYVQPGETLWSIASEHPVKGVSTQELVQYISGENGISNSALMPGDKIVVPAA